MNKVKLSFKIKELELQVEGTKDQVSNITNSFGHQLKGLMQPAINSTPEPEAIHQNLAITEDGEMTEIRSTKKRRPPASQAKGDKAKAIDFKNDPPMFGFQRKLCLFLRKIEPFLFPWQCASIVLVIASAVGGLVRMTLLFCLGPCGCCLCSVSAI